MFNTAGGVLFGVKKYADALWNVVQERNITVNLRHELVEVKPDSKEAVFQLLDHPGTTKTFNVIVFIYLFLCQLGTYFASNQLLYC